MPAITRKAFIAGGASAALHLRAWSPASGASALDEELRRGIASRRIPAVVAGVATRRKTLYSGAFGTRDTSGVPVRPDSIFAIASMTKAITTTAALQLVEQGKLDLSEPVVKHLPQLANLEVLEGFDDAGKPSLRPLKTPITLRHLITHTSGFCYEMWDQQMFRYRSVYPAATSSQPGPLMFEPGTRWQYGEGLDWTGRLIEAVTGATLEDYFQEKILRPLGMNDTSYLLAEAKFDRLVSNYRRDSGGDLKQDKRQQPARPKEFNGGGGLYSTAADYLAFMRMILNHGAGPNGARILRTETVDSMLTNQIGDLTAGKMKSYHPELSRDVDIQPGHAEKWTFGFLLNPTAYDNGRSAGSAAWAGFFNTFYWIDPKADRCGVILMQFLPFVDKEAVGLLNDFEKAVYRFL
jgi:CubicO group peptidase (beta-lactamase class C family)